MCSEKRKAPSFFATQQPLYVCLYHWLDKQILCWGKGIGCQKEAANQITST